MCSRGGTLLTTLMTSGSLITSPTWCSSRSCVGGQIRPHRVIWVFRESDGSHSAGKRLVQIQILGWAPIEQHMEEGRPLPHTCGLLQCSYHAQVRTHTTHTVPALHITHLQLQQVTQLYHKVRRILPCPASPCALCSHCRHHGRQCGQGPEREGTRRG